MGLAGVGTLSLSGASVLGLRLPADLLARLGPALGLRAALHPRSPKWALRIPGGWV